MNKVYKIESVDGFIELATCPAGIIATAYAVDEDVETGKETHYEYSHLLIESEFLDDFIKAVKDLAGPKKKGGKK